MMFHSTSAVLRSAVAFFNMKHFQVKQKIKVTPSTIHDVFSTYLRPDDRLLRQSRAGAGATRVLVLNKFQMVKAVYLPVLCMPHPSVVSGDEAVLGLPVRDYLETVKSAKEQQHMTFAALSYPKGISFSVYDTAGAAQMPMVNLMYSDVTAHPDVAKGIGKHAFMNAGNANNTRAKEFAKALWGHHELIAPCSTFFMINRERGSCLMLSDVQRLARLEDPEEEVVTGLEDKEEPLDPETLTLFSDASRWMSLPEQALQSNPSRPLYNRSIPNEDGLTCAMGSGVLLLDFTPKSKSEEKQEKTG